MARVTRWRQAGEAHAVLSVEGAARGHRRRPCRGCPWVVDNTGTFPPEAFVHSARTAYDAATESFGCHESDPEEPLTCAGFLLRNADHNLRVRVALAEGRIRLDDVREDSRDLHPSYRAMAEANGVPADHPALERCRANGEHIHPTRGRR